MLKKILRFFPALIWMGVIFYFSSRDTSGVVVASNLRFAFFKSLHLIEYIILGILLFVAFLKYKYAIITGYFYAITDEIHQSFMPHREARLTDSFIDLLGILIGLFLIRCILKKK